MCDANGIYLNTYANKDCNPDQLRDPKEFEWGVCTKLSGMWLTYTQTPRVPTTPALMLLLNGDQDLLLLL